MKQLPKRVLSSVLTGAMLFSLMSSAGFAVGTEETPGQETTEISLNTAPAAAELVGVQALTTPGHFGQKLKAVMLEYSFAVDASQLDTESFQVLVTSNNLTGEKAEAKIARVYTNSAPELLDSGSEAGNYVIVELDDFDKVGLVADQYYYLDENNEEQSIAVRKDLMECYDVSVIQADDVYAEGDETAKVSASEEEIKVDQADIKHEVLDEFQYVHLTDEEANEVLADFEFKNDNSPYSISSNTTSIDYGNLGEDELLGDLNEASLAGLGVNIWYQLPDNYDPDKEYPLFLFAHGTGECYSTATTSAGTELNNAGVHFNISMMDGVWATTEDMGYDDVILVAPQYYSGNSPRADGYERDDAFRVALCYALSEFAVDRDRVYVSGTSQGAGRTTALLRDCADYITAVVIQNGGYSSALAREEDAVEVHKEIFQFAAENNVALWFFQGVKDFISPPLTAEVMYEAFLENYQEAGKSTEWLEDNVRFTYLNDKLYTDMNESSFHSTMKPTYLWYAYYNDELYNATYSDAEDSLGQYFDTKYGDNDPGGYTGMVDWLLSKNKSELDGGSTEQEKTPESLDGKPAPTYDYSDANQLPMTGYFTKTLSYEDVNGDAASREVYIYLSENASCRPYFYVIAVPSGTENVTQFLEERGWFDLADQKGECLFVITAGEGGYGTAEEEMAFMDAAMAWLNTPTADEPDPAYPDKNVNYWSAFGEWYFTGYGDGCAVLEAWAAKNPIFVIAQAYVDGQSVGQNYLDQVGAEVYPVGTNGYDITEDVKNRLGGEENMIHRGQIPVPTLFVGYEESDYSLQYWQNANYCQGAGASDEVYGTIYAQASDSEPWQTQYAGPISRVAVSDKGLTTGDLFGFLTYYTRYDNTSAYGNALMQRVEYSDVIVACHQSDDLYAEKKITTPDGQTGTMICTVEEINGELREILFYVPDNAAELQPNGAPILTVWAGGSQTNIIFFDSTCWWETANENGIALIFTNEAYNTSVAVSPKDIYECYETMMDLLKGWEEEGKFNLDFTRIYSTGQSMGSMESQQFAQESPEFYAAVASTSFYQNYPDTQSGDPIPTYLINGEGNGTDDTGTPFDDRWNRTDEWAQYFLTVNGFEYQEPVYDDEGNMTEFSLPVESVSGPYNRFETYTWNNANNIPIMQYTNSLYRPHNCLTSEIPMMWDFLEHYRYVQNEDGSITRYYSESAFQDPGDETVIFEVAADKVTDIDTVETAQIDYTQSAQIPLDGWYEKTLESGRIVELYFPEYAACRAYFTVVAIPDGVEDSTVWAEEQGYVELMEQRGEVLVLLKPGADGWGSMDDELAYVTEAMTFVNAGQNAGGVTLFTNYSTFYLVGYGGGAAALEAWAIDNPILVGSQAYVNGTAADADYRAQTGAKTYDGTNTGGYDPGIDDDDVFMQVLEDHGYEGRLIARSEVPVPTWFVGTADEASVDYWKSANDCLTTPEEDVYWQSKDSDAFQTEYANDCTEENHGISQVKVSGDTQTVTAQQLADFLYAYSRYNVPFAYSNHLSERQDYTAVRVEAQKEAQSGDYLTEEQKVSYDAPITASDGAVYDSYYVLSRAQGEVGEGIVESGIVAFSDDNGDGTLDAREYLMYVPDSAVENAPVVFQYPGMTQSVSVGFDSTQWWRVANDYGVIVVILGEAYNNGVALSWKNSDMAYYAVRDILENDAELSAKIDWNRIYGSGHSLGSSQVQGFTRTHPEFFAAVASTSFASTTEGSYEAVPTMLVIGQSDLPFLMDDLWTSDQLKTWFEYLAKSNDLKVTEATPDNADSKVEGEARTWTYTWNNEQDIPMVVWGQTYLREHNCYPAEIPMAWEFMSHYSMDSETGTRYYSESAFEETGDGTVIVDTAAECGMTEDDVVSIQATTTPNFYGQRLSQIVITFQEGTDMTGAANVANYKIWDRAFQNGAFEEGSNAITGVSVDGTTVTLTFDQGPANNEPFGMLATVSWNYARKDGSEKYNTIVTSDMKNDGDEFATMAYVGYQTRDNLDLVLQLGEGNALDENGLPVGGLAMTDFFGNKLDGTVWLDTIDEVYDDVTLEYFDLAVKPENYSQFDGKIPVYYYVPESYSDSDPMTLVLYVTGNGTSYFEKKDENGVLLSSNQGTDMTYDNCVASWYALSQDSDPDNDVIIGTVDVYSSDNPSAGQELGRVAQYFTEEYNIDKVVLIGNSNGTSVCSEAVRQFPELIDAFIVNNGCIGTQNRTSIADNLEDKEQYNWAEEDIQAIVDNGVAFWILNGEKDNMSDPTYALKSMETLREYYEAAGYSDEWMADNLRVSFYKDYKFAEWGVNNHSCIKITSWYYVDQPYLDVYQDSEPLEPGDTYQMSDALDSFLLPLEEYTFTVYPESVSEWVLNVVDAEEDDDDDNQGGGGGGGSSSRYTVTVADASNGSVRVSTTRASAGTRVTITADPDTGYEVDSVTVTAANGSNVTVTERSSTSYTFNMPSRNVEVEVTFVQTGSQGGSDSDLPFGDVASGDWFYDAVEYAYENGLMTGTGANSFTPNGTLTRAMVVQVLYSMEDVPASGSASFTDVADEAWYADAVNWAASNGVVSGYGDGTFGPEDNVTREQVATILYAYARAKGYDVSAAADLSGYTDASSVSSYADGAMSWAVGAGLISGIGNNLVAPQGTATRAQFAVMLMNFCENIVE